MGQNWTNLDYKQLNDLSKRGFYFHIILEKTENYGWFRLNWVFKYNYPSPQPNKKNCWRGEGERKKGGGDGKLLKKSCFKLVRKQDLRASFEKFGEVEEVIFINSFYLINK